MTRNEAIDKLESHRAEFNRLGVEHLYLFGSTALDEARTGSDVDLFFDHPKGEIGLFEVNEPRRHRARSPFARSLRQKIETAAKSDRPFASSRVASQHSDHVLDESP